MYMGRYSASTRLLFNVMQAERVISGLLPNPNQPKLTTSSDVRVMDDAELSVKKSQNQ